VYRVLQMHLFDAWILVARAGLRLVLLVLGMMSRLVVGRYGAATATGLGGRRLLAGLTTAVLVRLSALAPSDLGLLGLRHVAPPVSLVPVPYPGSAPPTRSTTTCRFGHVPFVVWVYGTHGRARDPTAST